MNETKKERRLISLTQFFDQITNEISNKMKTIDDYIRQTRDELELSLSNICNFLTINHSHIHTNACHIEF